MQIVRMVILIANIRTKIQRIITNQDHTIEEKQGKTHGRNLPHTLDWLSNTTWKTKRCVWN